MVGGADKYDHVQRVNSSFFLVSSHALDNLPKTDGFSKKDSYLLPVSASAGAHNLTVQCLILFLVSHNILVVRWPVPRPSSRYPIIRQSSMSNGGFTQILRPQDLYPYDLSFDGVRPTNISPVTTDCAS